MTRVERELTRWQPEGPFIDPGLSEGPARFGRPTAGSVTGWDQFEVNRERFQVRGRFHRCMHAAAPLSGRCAHCTAHPFLLCRVHASGPLLCSCTVMGHT